MKLLFLLYYLKSNKIFIWTEDSRTLSISFDNNCKIINSLQNELKENKVQLLKILDHNNINSERKSKEISYYKIPSLLQQNTLSCSQKAIYLHSKLERANYIYNIPVFLKCKQVNIDKLKESLIFVLKKHSILRMTINKDFRYKILDIEKFEIEESIADFRDALQFCIEKAKNQFYLDGGKLIRLEIINIKNSDEIILNLTHHHILSDAYSVGIIVSEVLSIYKALLSSNNSFAIIDQNQSINYFDYISYQNYQLQTKRYQEAISNLTNKLHNAKPIQLKKNSAIFDNKEDRIDFELNLETYQKLQELSFDNGVSLYSILLTCLYHILSVYSIGQTDFALGVTISNRPFEFNDTIGPFISTLPLIPQYNPNNSLIDNLKNFHREMVYLNEYQEINLNLLTENLKYHPDYITQLIHVNFSLHNFKQEFENSEFEFLGIKEIGEKTGISIIAEETGNGIHFSISYAKNLYEKSYIESIVKSYVTFLIRINKLALFKQINQLDYLDDEEYEKIIYKWNDTDNEYRENATISELFQETVSEKPDSIAVVFENIQLTYEELNTRSNKLANYLIANYHIKPENLISLCLDRSEYMLVAILAVLKTGGAYVPIDPTFPYERIDYILKDTNSNIVLTNELYKKRLEERSDVVILEIDSREFQEKLLLQPTATPRILSTNRNLAYVIYTSGTTGKPKGVMIEHKSVLNYIYNLNDLVELAEKTVDFSSNLGFDLTITTTICSLCSGANVVVYDKELQNLELYKQHLIKNSINLIKLTPSYFELLIHFLQMTKIKKIILGGEKLSTDVIHKFISQSKDSEIVIYDEYGPTEATVGTSQSQIYPNHNLNIGKPYNNEKVYILDRCLNPLPIGAIGELYIGGVGLARGYLSNSGLTAEKFIANPFQTKEEKRLRKNTRLYKTGDLVSLSSDGNLEYIGRNDSQIKLRGYRIELGEIENVLKRHMDLKQVVVALKEDNTYNKVLVAYVVPGEFVPSITELKDFLNKILPEYMVPSFFIYLKKLPFNTNGKLDRKELPDLEFLIEEKHKEPRDELERKLITIWSEILGLPELKIGLNSDFFQLGGNSLLVIKLVNKLNQSLNCNIGLTKILQNTTINKLYCFLNSELDILQGQTYEF